MKNRMRVRACLLLVFSVLFGTAVLTPPATGETYGKAGIVVQHGDGSIKTKCVRLDKPSITGLGLLRRSKLAYRTAYFDGLGKAVCWLDGEGVYTRDPSKCFSDPDGEYWGYWKQDKGDPAPVESGVGPESRKVRKGSVNYWVWATYPQKKPAETTVRKICS